MICDFVLKGRGFQPALASIPLSFPSNLRYTRAEHV
jgi:hypothetical protein